MRMDVWFLKTDAYLISLLVMLLFLIKLFYLYKYNKEEFNLILKIFKNNL
jgi:hypothetical protein